MVEYLAQLRQGDGHDDDGVEEYRAYAKLRSPRQTAFMLELRFASGESQALAYSYLSRTRFDSTAGMMLHFAGVTVVVTGRKLRPLYESVLLHRVTWIQAMDSHQLEEIRDPEETLVTGIGIAG